MLGIPPLTDITGFLRRCIEGSLALHAGSEHGIDNFEGSKMYCLELMQPNDMFAELVRAGMPAGVLENDDLCMLIAAGCSNL